MKFSLLILIGLTVSAPALAGNESSGGLPNPYAMFCEDHGAISVSVSGISGVEGLMRSGMVCQFHFAEVEVSTLYSVVTQGRSTQATDAYLKSDFDANVRRFGAVGPDRAAKLCVALGGVIHVYPLTMREDNHLSTCDFPDGSSVEEWTLFWGKGYGPDLIKLLSPR